MKDVKYPLCYIIIGQQPWDTEIGSNCKDIALELSKTNKVLYINSPLDRITLWRNRNDPKVIKRLNVIRGKDDGLIKIQENLWNYYPDCMVESINWLSSDWLFNLLNKRNNKKLAQSIQKAIARLGFEQFILFNDNEMFKAYYLQDFLKPLVSTYYSRDYMIAVDYWKTHGEKLEPILIEKSDLCFANSTYLSDYCKQYNPRSYYIGQGCDLHDFQNPDNLKLPDDLKDIKNKIIGYVGSLNSLRLDIDVIETIALNFPDSEVVLVGPEDDVFRASNLHQIKNVHFLGLKTVNQLPAYVNAFDICINPQIVNEVTIGNYPRKIDEYLSLGKPTVATSTKTMEVFKEYVYLANTKEDYIELIKKAMAENSDALIADRIEFVSSHTWANSVKAMVDEIDIFLKEK
ncbi:MAG TPA: glycosyltransferase [Mucilaginibacter sp.]|jgi:glycosyltransferase involved in cell wall biosynthesis|nr:glycosyltransferase [Mucilaginibacter sp.]